MHLVYFANQDIRVESVAPMPPMSSHRYVRMYLVSQPFQEVTSI